MKRSSVLWAFIVACEVLIAQPTVQLEQVASGLGVISDIKHMGDDRIFCLAKNGYIRIVQNGSVVSPPFLDINGQVWGSGELGALGLAFDPDYAQNGYFYLHYSSNQGGVVNRVSRFTVSATDPNLADPASEVILWTYPHPSIIHKGGDLHFGPDGYLYFTLGDGSIPAHAQDLGVPLGSILRIDVSAGDGTYAIPPDNPYAGAGPDTLPEIWAHGMRNPWRMTFDALTGDVWISDVGWESWEELNFWPANDHSGPNFGWPCFEGFAPLPDAIDCGPASAYDEPAWVHPNGGGWCAVIGGRVYRGDAYPALYGRYLFSDYCAGVIHSLLPDGTGGWQGQQLASGLGIGITCIGENSALDLFLGKTNGILYKIIDPLAVATLEHHAGPFNVYPVPASDHIVIEGELQGAREYWLYDQSGRRVSGKSGINAAHRVELDVHHLANGTYVLVVNDATGTELARRLVAVAR